MEEWFLRELMAHLFARRRTRSSLRRFRDLTPKRKKAIKGKRRKSRRPGRFRRKRRKKKE